MDVSIPYIYIEGRCSCIESSLDQIYTVYTDQLQTTYGAHTAISLVDLLVDVSNRTRLAAPWCILHFSITLLLRN
jgi:hypothetical protein